MITRKILNIALVLILDLCILATGALGGDCCDKGWVKCCELDFQLEDIAMCSALKYGSGLPIKCCDLEKCMDFVKLEAYIPNTMANEHFSVKIATVLTHNLSEIPADMGPGKEYHAETRLPAAVTYLQTLSFLC